MLIEDAKVIFRKAWSVRLALLSAIFSTLEVGLTDLLPPGVMAGLAMATALGSAIMRIVYQPKLHQEVTK
jgi:hypothetical protein